MNTNPRSSQGDLEANRVSPHAKCLMIAARIGVGVAD
jgi:hypothetical protein